MLATLSDKPKQLLNYRFYRKQKRTVHGVANLIASIHVIQCENSYKHRLTSPMKLIYLEKGLYTVDLSHLTLATWGLGDTIFHLGTPLS